MKNIKIAITGGIGSGKSTVCKFIAEAGYPVISCDEVYHDLLKTESFVLTVSEAMGIPPIRDDKGVLQINRKEISDKVFNDPSSKSLLEGVTHPAIMKEVYARADKYPVAFVEVPLLFECGLDKDFDHVIIVLAGRERRISAVMKRDGLSEKEVSERIKNQVKHENFRTDGHTVIYNDSTIEDLKYKVDAAVNEILQKTF